MFEGQFRLDIGSVVCKILRYTDIHPTDTHTDKDPVTFI